jgi:hypothetical protein
MSWRFRREYAVTHGRDGHALSVRDRWLPGVAAEMLSNAVLATLGHPCCGRGPFGRITATEVIWWRIMQWPCDLAHHDRPVMDLPLTTEQAAALRPDLVGDRVMFPPDGTDEFGYTWLDSRMTGTPDGPPDWREAP